MFLRVCIFTKYLKKKYFTSAEIFPWRKFQLSISGGPLKSAKMPQNQGQGDLVLLMSKKVDYDFRNDFTWLCSILHVNWEAGKTPCEAEIWSQMPTAHTPRLVNTSWCIIDVIAPVTSESGGGRRTGAHWEILSWFQPWLSCMPTGVPGMSKNPQKYFTYKSVELLR